EYAAGAGGVNAAGARRRPRGTSQRPGQLRRFSAHGNDPRRHLSGLAPATVVAAPAAGGLAALAASPTAHCHSGTM
ncbi:MAG TPA: hypothetical protein VNZ57_01830, partial [Longimicrobiales bacterium]|nr:hypothetical protein [Longimicrobiales bacterium]